LYISSDTGKIWRNNDGATQWLELATGSGSLHMAKMTRDAAQTVSHDTITKVAFDAEEYDVGGIADATTNDRFTVAHAGKYLVTASAGFVLDSTAETLKVLIYKNGVAFSSSSLWANNTQDIGVATVTDTLSLNAGDTMEMYAQWGGSDGAVAFASNEDNDNGRTRTIVAYNPTTGLLRAEYLSKSKITGYGMEIDRLYKDEATGIARVVSVFNGNYSDATSDTSPSDSLIYVVDGNTNDTGGTHLSLGITFSGYGSGNGTYEACVEKSDGTSVDVTSVTSNTFTCSSTGGTGGRATGYVTIVSNFTTQSVGSSPTWHLFTAAPTLTWTTPDAMLTTNVNAP
jgi:hypothetical protein